MNSKKVKIPQFLVQGKKQKYSVLVFPKKKWLWAYYAEDDEHYALEGDAAAYQQVKYALASLIANPGKIAYFPIRGDGYGEYFETNYDAVFTRAELQLKRSEWISLRRQLDKAHRIKRFELLYEPQKLYDHIEKLHESKAGPYRIWNSENGSVTCMENDTVFFSLKREICYAYHHSIITSEKLVLSEDGWGCFADIIGGIGYMITPGCKQLMYNFNHHIFPKYLEDI